MNVDFKTTFMTGSLLGAFMTKDTPNGTSLTGKRYQQVVFCMSERFCVLKEDAHRVRTPQDMPGPSCGSHDLRVASSPKLMQQGSS